MRGDTHVVNANWNPDEGQLNVNANDASNSNPNRGCRLSRRSVLVQCTNVLEPPLCHFATLAKQDLCVKVCLVVAHIGLSGDTI